MEPHQPTQQLFVRNFHPS